MSALSGRRVVVTRSSVQATALASLLTAAGAIPVIVPLIEIVPVATEVAALTAIDPAQFDWLVVTSPNGAHSYVGVHGRAPAQPHRIAAVGTATAAALIAAGLVVDLVPHEQSAAGVVAEFAPGDGRVLLVQAVAADAALEEGLTAKGWRLTMVTPYRSTPRRPTPGQQLEALAADAVMFASGSAVQSWVDAFGSTTPPIVVAIGPQTAQVATRSGLKVALVAADHSLSGMVDVLERHLAETE